MTARVPENSTQNVSLAAGIGMSLCPASSGTGVDHVAPSGDVEQVNCPGGNWEISALHGNETSSRSVPASEPPVVVVPTRRAYPNWARSPR